MGTELLSVFLNTIGDVATSFAGAVMALAVYARLKRVQPAREGEEQQ